MGRSWKKDGNQGQEEALEGERTTIENNKLQVEEELDELDELKMQSTDHDGVLGNLPRIDLSGSCSSSLIVFSLYLDL